MVSNYYSRSRLARETQQKECFSVDRRCLSVASSNRESDCDMPRAVDRSAVSLFARPLDVLERVGVEPGAVIVRTGHHCKSARKAANEITERLRHQRLAALRALQRSTRLLLFRHFSALPLDQSLVFFASPLIFARLCSVVQFVAEAVFFVCHQKAPTSSL